MTRRLALVAGALLLCGCGAGTVVPGAATTVAPTSSPATDPLATSSPAPEPVSVLAFDLPTVPGYHQEGTRIAENGAVVRRWRLKLDGDQRFCVVVAGEQPNFSGSFPASAIAAFRAGRDPGGRIVANQEITSVPGTVAGVRQESSYVFSLGSRGTETGILFVRQFLTTEHTLISLNVAGPEIDSDNCRLASIVDSLRVATPSDRSPVIESATPTVRPTSESEESPS